jgi:hypothetical protein
MDGRARDDIANELYARGFTHTRQEAQDLVAHEPWVVATLLGIPLPGPEMNHHDDRAHPTEWGHADTGDAP